MLWRFCSVTEAVHQQPTAYGTIGAGITGFAGAQQFILPGFRECYAGCKTQCRCRGACHTASADLKELPSADLHGLLLVSTLSRPIYIRLLRVQGVGVIFLCGRGRKGPELAQFPSIQEGFVTEYHNVGVCVLIWLRESEKTQRKEIENVTNITGVRQIELWRRDDLQHPRLDEVAEEVPVALVYNGISHVVMMASPKDLEYFALGFSLSEGIIESPRDIFGMDVVPSCNGLEVQIELSSRRFMGLKERRRALAGRTGCGVCGVEQLNDIGKPVQPLPFTQTFDLNKLDDALRHLNDFQPVGQLTGCTHAAAWMLPSGELVGGHEDVGRHVALDKLLGRRSQEGESWQQGAVLVSSRASYEMVQKSAMCGVEILFAVSAATTLAVEVAERCNLTLVGFCKPGRATVYTHPQRLSN